MDAALIAFVITVMVFVSWNVSSFVAEIVVAPMDRMLSTVREHASRFMQTFNKMEDGDDSVDEIVALERVFKKLAKLYDLGKAENIGISDEVLETMSPTDKAVVGQAMAGVDTKAASLRRDSLRSNDSG